MYLLKHSETHWTWSIPYFHVEHLVYTWGVLHEENHTEMACFFSIHSSTIHSSYLHQPSCFHMCCLNFEIQLCSHVA